MKYFRGVQPEQYTDKGIRMKGLAILLGFNFAGLFVRELLAVPLPANVIGLVLFTAALFLGIVKLEWVEDTAAFLLRHMFLFFAPLIVGVIAFLPWIGAHFAQFLAGLVISTAAVILVTGGVTALIDRTKSSEEEPS